MWSYSHEFVQFSNHLNAADFAVVPVMIALIHQTFSTWGRYLLASIAVSLVCAFIGLPLFVYLGITELSNWAYINSFFTLFLTGVLVKIIVHFITARNLKVEHPAKSEPKINFNFFQRRRKAR
ncbi:hypothetical protein EHS13_16975 [Paenibacillus psychroresistens]|uniref:Uncharacterized protein n=1 Tax=Paenibacillus psychroresistens TaxID=1778678 RepID=A0A6B8RLQ0_9BACL|nr:hypothetical protein [Paenibacillus psychroresistens]QGQ96455.1 hypothetical protein EHS13_16975 [Paenibacillus psychroresistens]